MSSNKPTPEADQRLSQLLRLKRQERPEAAFWDKFDRELRSKQLSALVRTQSWYERLGKLSILVARKSATATATVSVFALGIFAVSKSEYFANNELDASQPAFASTQEAPPQSAVVAAPLFIVEENFVAVQEIASMGFMQPIDAQPHYEIHTLAQPASPSNYQIIAAPKQFITGNASTESSLGAKVIRTRNRF